MKMMYVLLALAAIALVAFVMMKFMKKKEKFVMKLYRPTPVVNVPENEWDPASMLTAVIPSKNGLELVTQKGNYRRFNRV